MDWIGVNGTRLDWTGVNGIGLDWIRVNGTRLDWNRLELTGLDWIGMDWIRVNGTRLDWIGLDWNGLELMRLDWVVVPTFAVKSVAIAVAMFTAPEGHADVGIGGVIVHRQLAGLRPSVKRLLQNSPAQHAPPHCLSHTHCVC